MAKVRKNPVALHEIAEARKLLAEVQAKLRQQGITVATFNQDGREALIEFDIMAGLSVYNHGQRRHDVQCIACPSHPALQYEFIIEDLHGEEHRPIGSTCIFKRSLGVEEAGRIGNLLVSKAKAYFKVPRKAKKAAARTTPHMLEHRRIRHEAGSVRAYLDAVGLDWLALASIQGDPWIALTLDDRQTVSSVLDTGRPLSESEFEHFQSLNQERAARQQGGVTLAEERARNQPPVLERRPPVSRALTGLSSPKPKKTYFDRLKHEKNPSPLTEEVWSAYIKHVGYDYDEEDWRRIEPYMSAPRLRHLQRKMARRVPLNEGDFSEFRRAHQLMQKAANSAAKPAEPLYRNTPLDDNAAMSQLTDLLSSHLYGGGYQTEWRLFQNIEALEPWIKKFLRYDLARVQERHIVTLSGADMIRIARIIAKNHEWAPSAD